MNRWMPCIGPLAALFIATCHAWSAPPAVDESSTAGERPFAMGFLPIPRQPLSKESWLETWDELLQRNAEFVRTNVEVDWEDFLESPDPKSFGELQHLTFASGMAKRSRLKSVFVITPTDSTTGEFHKRLPERMGDSFGDKQVRQAFANCTIRIAKDYKPEYLALGNEINTYFKHHPDDVANFLSLYQEIYAAVKEASPATRMTISAVSDLLPELIWNRPKRPYRAPIHASFFPAGNPLDWVAEVLSPKSIRAVDCFNPDAVAMLRRKLERTGSLGETDDMALAGVLSTQLVHQHFVADSPAPEGLNDDDRVKVVQRNQESSGGS